jgi:hypothetical protein
MTSSMCATLSGQIASEKCSIASYMSISEPIAPLFDSDAMVVRKTDSPSLTAYPGEASTESLAAFSRRNGPSESHANTCKFRRNTPKTSTSTGAPTAPAPVPLDAAPDSMSACTRCSSAIKHALTRPC